MIRRKSSWFARSARSPSVAIFINFLARKNPVLFKIAENSLFAQLLRSPWWVSFAIAGVLMFGLRMLLPEQLMPYAFFVPFPFAIIGVIAAWKQWQLPSAARVKSTVEAVTAMSWRDFSALLEQAFTRDGYTVTPMNGAVDFKLTKTGRTSFVSGKRWKAASLGLEPLRELYAARQAQDAHEAIFISLATLTENAQGFVTDRKIVLMQGAELARLLRLPKKAAKSRALVKDK